MIDGVIVTPLRQIADERGKVMKGPNYWKPEPKIREILAE